MCMICVDWKRGSLTNTEARRNLDEWRGMMPQEHVQTVEEMILLDEFEEFISNYEAI